jgi:hypothetical protein
MSHNAKSKPATAGNTIYSVGVRTAQLAGCFA